MSLELSLYSARLSERENTSGNVAGDDAAGADGRIVTDGDAGHDQRTRSKPNLIADADGRRPRPKWRLSGRRRPVGSDAIVRAQRMERREQLHSRPEQSVRPDVNLRRIEEDASDCMMVVGTESNKNKQNQMESVD
jgi:hypothetical protein